MDTQDLFLEIGREFHLTYDQVSEICNRLTGRFLEITSSTREQIAGEILAKCENKTETNTSEFGSCEVVGCLEFIQLEDTAYYEVTCTHAEDAAIAGGG